MKKELYDKLQKNLILDFKNLVEQYCKEHIPSIKPIRPQASFLVWLNCQSWHLEQSKIVDLFVNKAHLALNDGAMFGIGGEGFMRINVGTPRAILAKALEQLATSVDEQLGKRKY